MVKILSVLIKFYIFRKENIMLVRLFASEYLAGKVEIKDIPERGNLRASVIKYLREQGVDATE